MIDFQFKSDTTFGGKPFPNGIFSGYATVFNHLDRGAWDENGKHYADIILATAYSDKALAKFVKEGRAFNGHQFLKGANPSETVAFPLEASKDDTGLRVTMAWHGDTASQDLRMKSEELHAAGKIVPLSQVVKESKNGTHVFFGKDNIVKAINQYVKPEWKQEALDRVAELSYVRVLAKDATLAFVDVVSRACEPMAMADTFKEDTTLAAPIETPKQEKTKSTFWTRRMEKDFVGKGAFEDEIVERESGVYFLWDMFLNCYYDVQCMEEAAESLGIPYDTNAAYTEIVNEFSTRLLAAVIDEETTEDLGKHDTGIIGANVKQHPLSLRGQAEGLGLLAKGLISRVQKTIEPLEVGKESRVLSDATLSNVEDAANAIQDLANNHGAKLSEMAKSERTRRDAKKKKAVIGKEDEIIAPVIVAPKQTNKLSIHDLKRMGYTIPTQSVQ